MPRVGVLMMRSSADVVARVVDQMQIGEHVLDFLPLVELQAVDDLVRNALLAQRRARAAARGR